MNGYGGNYWSRVTRVRACPICGKGDLCLISADGTAAICPRVREGSLKRCGEAGWLHVLRPCNERRHDQRVIHVVTRPAPRDDLGALASQWQRALKPGQLEKLGDQLGLSVESLRSLNVGWSSAHRAWSFSMKNADGAVVGIRLRLASGRKFCVAGSQNALFIPDGVMEAGGCLLVCEGATDVAAMLDLGFQGIGRPNCSGGTDPIVQIVKRKNPRRIVIVADGDEAGMNGGERLASALLAHS